MVQGRLSTDFITVLCWPPSGDPEDAFVMRQVASLVQALGEIPERTGK